MTLEWTSAHIVGVGAQGTIERVLATVLFTDIVDSTATLGRIGDEAWRELLNEHNRRLRDQLNRHRGREIDTTGDGFLAVFDSASRAVACGLAMVSAAREMGISIRVGVHTGEVEFVGGDARGVAVHAAARVLSRAGPDEVLVSSTTRDLLEGSGLTLEDAGTHDLKGLSGSRSLYRVAAVKPSEPTPSRLSLRQPPARLLAMICRNIARSARSLIGSPRRKATVRAVWLSWPAVMMPSGSGTIAPSYRKTLTWSLAASSAQMLPSRTK